MADVPGKFFSATKVRTGVAPSSSGSIVGEPLPPVNPPGSSLNSVGLTMPSAFTVSNSPLTANGTIGVAGAGTVGQYIRGDGSLADFPQASGGGSSVSYYLNGSISQGTIGGVAYKELNKVPILGAGTQFSINADGYIASFLTDAGDPNLLEIPGGNWNFETYFSASSSGGTPTFYVELYKYDGTTFTLIASSSTSPELIAFGTNLNPYFSTLAVPTTTLALTDRLAVRFYVTHSGRTITMHTENNTLCQIVTTFTTGLTSLNGLTAQVQNLAVGTSGTDFNIASATATHTFNLPTASATNRGALSSSDWSLFTQAYNDKINSAAVTGTTTKTLTLTQQDGGTITASWSDLNTDAVTSVFGRTGAVVAANGDYTTAQVTESGNLYYTDARSRAALSFLAGSGAYNSSTGVITIPTNNNQITNGAGYITSAALAAYLPLAGGTLTGPLNGTSASFSSVVNTTSVFRLTQASVARGGLYTYNQVLGSGTDYGVGIYSEGEIFLVPGGITTKRFTMATGGDATFSSSVGVGGSPTNRLTALASETGTQITTIPVAKFVNTGNAFSKVVIGSDNANFDGVISMDNNATLANTKLRFYIGNGAGSTAGHSNDQLVLQGNGNFGIGTASVGNLLTVSKDLPGEAIVNFSNLSSTGFGLAINSGGGTRYSLALNDYSGTPIARFLANGNVLIGTTDDNSNKLRVNGTIFSDSSVTANSFIRSGGTSAQFLKADGSVDSNTYVTGGPFLPLTGGTLTGALNGTSASFSSVVNTTSIYRITQASVSRGGLYTYNQVLGSGTDYGVGVYSEAEAFIVTGGTTIKRVTISSTGAATFVASLTGTQITTIPVAKFANTGNAFSKVVIGSDNANYDAVISMDNNATLANTKLRFYIGNGTGSTAGHSNDQLVLQGNGNLGINTDSPSSKLQVAGSFALPHTTKSENYTLTATDFTVGFDCASSRTANLPDATTCAGRIYVIYQYNTGSGARSVTLDGNGSQTINGATTYSLFPYCDFTSVMIQSNGSNWIIIASNLTADCL